MIGIDPESEGLRRAAALGLATSHEGVDWLLTQDELPDLVFEATSAYVHRAVRAALRGGRHPRGRPHPGGRGPGGDPPGEPRPATPTRPTSTWSPAAARRPSRWSPRCPGSPRVAYAEIVATVASRSAGPGTRQNIDEFTRTTARGVEVLGGAERGKAIIILNPAEPPLTMRDTIFCSLQPDADDAAAVTASSRPWRARCSSTCPATGCSRSRRSSEPSPADARRERGRHLRRGRGRRRLPPALRRQPRHHDRRRRPGRRPDRRALAPQGDS